ncbi:unnamed protein product (macronuclear) [Paramecium tetraurelia]|uniref:Alanine dehydrogenase/pyridine nucleotide transhydrogenase N-terminal domain-containing protein n=1 Tax=Paramecium tetraurelia TaxID=5888 RepID=A0BRH3_PARTE|nr:uncharacterized protein GSPATT00031371001 [Paramecium tetraurelia]CAK61140.1 unnamed protein product [Paramecium tetraurelia]|eukprot:XP_001428538.1 hypothetical protein (macronuclear) [Paramecium tetraurelia strain d4-2]
MDKLYIGIRAEDKSYMERRTPIPPHDCKYIMEKHNQIQIIVQPSTKRIFTDDQYLEVGCLVQDDLSICRAIICIKEIPIEKYIEGMTYLNWSHTLEGEPYNMPALDVMLKKNIRHLEYERIYDDNGVNITSFPYAGIAGIITFLNEYGKYLLKRDMNTPFLQIGPTFQYYNKKDAYEALQKAGQAIQERGLPPKLGLPLIIGVMGSTGSCGKGSLEALSQLQITLVNPEDLKELVRNSNDKKHRNTVYVCPFKTTDLVRHKHDVHKEFTSQDYYENPLDYEPIFHQKYLPYLTILVNDIYWEYKFPRYVTDSQIKELFESGNSRLQAVCDVTCDLEGSIQFLKKFTNPDHPVYYYNPISQQVHDEFDFESQKDIMYMSIDFLPSQMPYEASMDFGKALRNIVPYLAYSDPTKPLEESGLPEFLQNATVTLHGQLTQKFEYINELRKLNETETDHQKFRMITSYYSNKINTIKDNTSIDNKSLSQQQLSTDSDAQDDRFQSEDQSRKLHTSSSISETNIDEGRSVNNQRTLEEQIQIS